MSADAASRPWKWICLILVLAGLPYLAASLLTPPGQQFLGGLFYPVDLNVYLAAMRQGAQGAWSFRLTFTPEAMSPKLADSVYLILGRVTAAAGVSYELGFHLARLLLSGLGLGLLARWLKRMPLGPASQDAFLLMAFSGGLGWIALPLGRVLPDVHLPEWTVFMSIFHAPHFVLGLVGQVLVVMSTIEAYDKGSGKSAWPVAGALVGASIVGLAYPFSAVPLCLSLGLYLLVDIWTRRQVAMPGVIAIAAAFAVLVPLELYYAFVSSADPAWQAVYVSQNVAASPSLLEVLAGLGLPGLGAIAGALAVTRVWRQAPPGLRFCLVWSATNLAVLYAPVTFQARMSLGLYLPVCVLASWGLHKRILPWIEQQGMSAARCATIRRSLLLLSMPSMLTVLLVGLVSAWTLRHSSYERQYYYQPLSEARAADWLGRNSDESAVVLTSQHTGNYLPRVIMGRVFSSYFALNPPGKMALVRQFFDPTTPDTWRRQLLNAWQISHIYYGHTERQLGPSPDGLRLPVVYQAEGVTIYQVK